MRVIQDKEFEEESFKYLKKHFDRVIWLSKNSSSKFDFLCWKGRKKFNVDSKIGRRPVLSISQKDCDYVLFKNSNTEEIKLIPKNEFEYQVRFLKSVPIKVSEEIKNTLDSLKEYDRESYSDVISKLLLLVQEEDLIKIRKKIKKKEKYLLLI